MYTRQQLCDLARRWLEAWRGADPNLLDGVHGLDLLDQLRRNSDESPPRPAR